MPGTLLPVAGDPPVIRHRDIPCTTPAAAAVFDLAERHPATHSEPAIRICRSCNHRAECLQWAIENPQVGVWGAMTANQRTRERERQERERRRRP